MGAKKEPKERAKALTKAPKKKERGGGKAKKEKWSKGKSRDKLHNLVLLNKGNYDKLIKEVPTYKLITPSIVTERLKVLGSLSRRALLDLAEKGLIKKVVAHRSQCIYTRVTKDNADEGGACRGWSCYRDKEGKEEQKGEGSRG